MQRFIRPCTSADIEHCVHVTKSLLDEGGDGRVRLTVRRIPLPNPSVICISSASIVVSIHKQRPHNESRYHSMNLMGLGKRTSVPRNGTSELPGLADTSVLADRLRAFFLTRQC